MQTDKMKLRSMVLAGYKSYSNEYIDEIRFTDVNVIIGANGAGKSNLISFFDLLGHMMTGHLQGFISEQGQAHSILYFGPKKTEIIGAKLILENDEKTDTYEFELKYAINDILVFNEESLTYESNTSTTLRPKKLEYGVGHLESGLINSKEQTADVFSSILRSFRVFHFNDTSSTAKVRMGGNVDDSKYLRDDAGNLAAFLYRLKSNKDFIPYYKRIVKFVKSSSCGSAD